MNQGISTYNAVAPHLHRGQQVLLGVPSLTPSQVPTHLSGGGGVLDAAHRHHPERFDIEPQQVERVIAMTVEDIDDTGDTVVLTISCTTFQYGDNPAVRSAYEFALLPTAEVEVIALGL